MAKIDIRIARTPEDIAAVQQLCRDFVTWLLGAFPERRGAIQTYFEPVKWQETLADLPKMHARPKGAMLLARLNGEAVGCIMYHEMQPGIAEIKRLFVLTSARGTGAGKRLVDAALAGIADDGYATARLDTTVFLTAAIALYKSAGFRVTDPFIDFPADVQAQAVFMERAV